MSVGGNSYDEDDDEVFVGEEPVETVAMTRWDEAGEDKVSWEERVDVGTGTVAATAAPSAGVVVVVVGARGNFIFGDTTTVVGAAIVGWAGRCCRADNSAKTSMRKSRIRGWRVFVENEGGNITLIFLVAERNKGEKGVVRDFGVGGC